MSHEATPVLSEDAPRADKIIALPGATEGYTAATYCIQDEDHTLGNLLRWMIMKNPDVEFCGYSAPHPSEPKIHIRIQMYDNKSSLDALHAALDNLEAMTESILEAYQASLASGDYDRPQDEEYDFKSVNNRLWAQKEAEGRGSREDYEREKREKAEKEKEDAEKAKSKGKKVKAGR